MAAAANGRMSRSPYALTMGFLLVMAASSIGAAGAAPSPTGANPTNLTTSTSVSTSTTANTTTTYTSSETVTNSTTSQPQIGALTLLYYFIPELTVLAFFAVGLYLILVRGGRPGNRRRREHPQPPANARKCGVQTASDELRSLPIQR
jgi:hypothetical protein